MKCPHCGVDYHDKPLTIQLGKDIDGDCVIDKRVCSACGRMNLELKMGAQKYYMGSRTGFDAETSYLVHPKGSLRPPCPSEVPKKFEEDYSEACLVLSDSPKASAALSRRCLQNILHEVVNVKHGNLADEIQEVIDSGKLPTPLADSIDAVRNIGNFAAHPIKSEKTGEIIAIEPGEAEWNLDVLEALFDYYFVQPTILKKKKATLNKKLKEAGKPPMK